MSGYLIGVDWSREARLAYIAGILDGEGYIGAKRRMPTHANRMNSPKYSIAVSVSMTDEGPIRMIAEFCGASANVKARKRTRTGKVIYQLDLENKRAEVLLRQVRPYLVAKNWQAKKAISLHELRSESRKHRTRVVSVVQFSGGRNAGASHRVFGLSLDFLARCDAIYTELLRNAPRSGSGVRFRAGVKV